MGIVDREPLQPNEVARMLRVNPKTVTRWTRAGKLSSIVTPGGHHRFFADEIQAIVGRPKEAPWDAEDTGEV